MTRACQGQGARGSRSLPVNSLQTCKLGFAVQLFQPEQAVPVSTSAGGYQPAASGIGNVTNTLDEPIWETVKRDLKRIYRNLVMVVFPFKDRSQQSAALRNWDLWGPMAFTLALAIILSLGAAKASTTFSVRALRSAVSALYVWGMCACACPLGGRPRDHLVHASTTLPPATHEPPSSPLTPPQMVFGLLSVGAIVLTVNVVLLGGTIGFFQSLCLLGYCLFPMDVVAITCLFVPLLLVRGRIFNLSKKINRIEEHSKWGARGLARCTA
jgi:hypothetical protein